MVLASQNTDLVFSYLRLVYPRLELSLKEEFDKFIDGVKTIITSNTNLKPLIDSKLGEIFKLRLSGLKFIFAEGNGNLLKMIDDVIPQFEEMRTIPGYLFLLKISFLRFDAIEDLSIP